MTLSEEKTGKVLILGLGGKIDVEGAKTFMEKITQILDAGESHLLLDFTDVVYINSSGLRGLVVAAKRLAGSGGKMVLAGVSEPIRKIFEMTGLASIFTVRPTKAESLSLFAE